MSSPEIAALDQEKQAAARAAVELITPGSIVGLGSGSTATYAIRFVGERVRDGLKIVGVPLRKRPSNSPNNWESRSPRSMSTRRLT